MPYATELALALTAAKEAGDIQLASAQTVLAVELKEDSSPVTNVDRACEKAIKERLMSAYPDDGFYGEESPHSLGKSGRQWIVDPLDGTRPYLHGIPTYSVLIALEEAGDPVVGAIFLPAMGLTCWASRGSGAFLNGKPIHVSSVSSSGSAMGTALGFVEKAELPEGKRLMALMRTWNYAYGFMDAYSYVCVANGSLDIAVNLLDKPWDCASAACIVREAGGSFSAITGEKSVHLGSIVLSNGLLHDTTIRHFSCSG
jgi:histidinol-phosphatase